MCPNVILSFTQFVGKDIVGKLQPLLSSVTVHPQHFHWSTTPIFMPSTLAPEVAQSSSARITYVPLALQVVLSPGHPYHLQLELQLIRSGHHTPA